MNDCVFCKIIKGELPSRKIYENKHTLCFMDISTDVDFHLLVIPKKHVVSILDCDSKTLNEVFKTVKHVSNLLTEKCGFSGVNLLNASGKSAGQSVDHFHIHLIPRKNDDKIDAWPKFEGTKNSLEQNFKFLTDNI